MQISQIASEVQKLIGGSIPVSKITSVLNEMFPKGVDGHAKNAKEFVQKYPEVCRPSRYS